MFQDRNHNVSGKGDQATLEEANFAGKWEVESRCESVESVVAKGIMPLARALKAYDVSFRQFLGYLMLENRPKKVTLNPELMVNFVGTVLEIIDFSKLEQDNQAIRLVDDMQKIAHREAV